MFSLFTSIYVQFGSKVHFLCEKTPNFSKNDAFGAKFWALRAQNLAPNPKILEGQNSVVGPDWGLPPNAPPPNLAPCPPIDFDVGGGASPPPKTI